LAEALADNLLTPLSILPGRIRWQIAGLKSNGAAGALLESLLAASDWIQSAVVNVATGRVLVRFDPELVPEIIESTVRDAAQSAILVEDEGNAFATVSPEERQANARETRRKDLLSSAGVGVSSASIGFFFSLGPATAVGIGVVSGAAWFFGKRIHRRVQAEIGLAKKDSAVFAEAIQNHRDRFIKATGVDVLAGLFGAGRIALLGGAINAAMTGWTLKIPGLALGVFGTGAVMFGGAMACIAIRGWYKNMSRVMWSDAARGKIRDPARTGAWIADLPCVLGAHTHYP
jgi:hypothetical protein